MTVPPGTHPGQVFRLAGQGLTGAKRRRGELLVTVQVQIPRTLTERQRRLLQEF